MSSKNLPRYEAGIHIYSNEEYKYKCRVCYRRPELQEPSWRRHLATEKHRQAYENYTKYFTDDTNDSMTCKICKYTKIKWFQIQDHAASHKLRPWYFPRLTDSRLFENFIIQGSLSRETYNYYCHICMKEFFFWWQACEHTTDVNHLELRRKMYTDSQLTKFLFSKTSILFYCRKCVFPLSDRMAWCWVCDEKILIANINVHCDGPRHLAAKKRAIELIEENKKEKLSLAVVDESRDNCSDKLCNNVDVDDEDKAAASQTNSSDKSKSKESVTTTTKPPSKLVQRYACSMCNVRLVEKKHIEIHLNGSSHKNQLEKLKTKFEKEKNLSFYDLPIGIKSLEKSLFKFKCCLCQSNILTFSGLILHVQSENHLKNEGDIFDSYLVTSVDNDLPERIVSTKLNDVFYCGFCICIIKGAKNITEHVQEFDHRRILIRSKIPHLRTRSVKHYLSKDHQEIAKSTLEFPPEIKFIEGEKSYYWCSVCECILYKSFENEFTDDSTKIWRHVGGTNHYFNKKKFNAKQQAEKLSTESNLTVDNDEEEEINSLPVEELYDIQLKDEELISVSCKPCEMHIYGIIEEVLGDWNHHLATKSHHHKQRFFSIKENLTTK